MNKKVLINSILIAIIVGLAVISFNLIRAYSKVKQDNNRLKFNIYASNKAVEYLLTKDHRVFARIDAITSKVDELEGSVKKEIKNLDIKVNHVVTYNETEITSEKEIITRLRDTAILSDSLSVIDYKDNFYQVFGLISADSARLNITNTDSLIQVVYKGQRISKKGKIRPNWYIFTPRRIQQSVFCKNPNSKIKYSKYIIIQK